MGKRPRIGITPTNTDRIVEITGWCILAATWLLVLINYASLPDTIPIHYNAAGIADRFGEKFHILILPLIATVLFVGMTVLNRFPHIFNYPVKITGENALHQYTGATKMFRYLKLMVVVIFGLIALKTIQQANGLGAWFSPLILGLAFIILIYFIIMLCSNRDKKRKNREM